MHTHTPAPMPPHEEPFLMADLEMSAEQYNTMQKKKPAKYRNKKVRIDGHTFDSVVEGARYLELRQMQEGGLIRDLTLQPRFRLCSREGEHVTTYVADFSYFEIAPELGNWPCNIVVEDVKGVQTDVFRIKWKWLHADYHVDARLITRDMVDTRGMDQYVIEKD